MIHWNPFKRRAREEKPVDESRRALIGVGAAGPMLVAASSVPAGAAPASHPAILGAPVPFAHIRHEGVHYRVTEKWHHDNTRRWPHLAAMSRDELTVERTRILAKADKLHDLGQEIGQDEWEYAHAVNNHRNVRTMAMHLDGRDHREFNFEGLDQVHTNDVGPLTCGCKLRHVFDHHARNAVKDIFPHKPIRVCETHAHLQHDYLAHYKQAHADHGTVFG